MPKPLSVLLCALALVLGACGDDDDAQPAQKNADSAPPEERGPCKDADQPPTRDGGTQKKPAQGLDPRKAYEVVLATSCGEFTLLLDQKKSPHATASFVSLVRNGFYDDTIFHRILPGFVIQGGDPTVTGTGDPGYTTRDPVPANIAYTRGVAAMAKAGNEPPGTAGSQFIVFTGGDTGLPPEYALLGRVTEGMKTVHAIEKLGNPASGDEGIPLQSVVIEKATVRER